MADATSSEQESKNYQYVSERLVSLAQIDEKLVALLEYVSSAVEHLVEGKMASGDNQIRDGKSQAEHVEEAKESFKKDTADFMSTLESVATKLSREIVLLDRNLDPAIATNDSDHKVLLPLNITRKATWVGQDKMKQQVELLKELLNSTETEERESSDVEMVI